MLQEPINFNAEFESEVWNVFDMLGSKYLVFYSPNTRALRLIPPPPNTDSGEYADKNAVDWLINTGLVRIGEGQIPKFNGIERPTWYVLTETGQNAYDELSIFGDFDKKFIQRFRPSR